MNISSLDESQTSLLPFLRSPHWTLFLGALNFIPGIFPITVIAFEGNVLIFIQLNLGL